MTDLLSGPARPIIVLLLSALAIGLLDRLTRPRDSGILLVLLVADGALALLSLRARLPLHVVLGRWRDLSLLGFDWGLGVDGLAFLFDKGEIVRYGHGGDDPGVSAKVFYYPGYDIDVVILGNQSHCADPVAAKIHQMIVSDG